MNITHGFDHIWITLLFFPRRLIKTSINFSTILCLIHVISLIPSIFFWFHSAPFCQKSLSWFLPPLPTCFLFLRHFPKYFPDFFDFGTLSCYKVYLLSTVLITFVTLTFLYSWLMSVSFIQQIINVCHIQQTKGPCLFVLTVVIQAPGIFICTQEASDTWFRMNDSQVPRVWSRWIFKSNWHTLHQVKYIKVIIIVYKIQGQKCKKEKRRLWKETHSWCLLLFNILLWFPLWPHTLSITFLLQLRDLRCRV